MFPGNEPNYGGPRVWWISVHFRGRIGGAIIYFNPTDSRSIAIIKVCPLHGLMVNLEAQTSRHLQLKFWAPNLGDSSRYFCSRIVTKIHVWLSALQKRGTCPTERINKKCAQIMKRVFWRFYLVSHLSSGLIDSWKPVVTKTTKNKKRVNQNDDELEPQLAAGSSEVRPERARVGLHAFQRHVENRKNIMCETFSQNYTTRY